MKILKIRDYGCPVHEPFDFEAREVFTVVDRVLGFELKELGDIEFGYCHFGKNHMLEVVEVREDPAESGEGK